jgi:hypothetical protein
MNYLSQWLRPENGSAAQKMGSAAGCTARPKRTEAGREAFCVRGATQTDRFRRFGCPKWVGPLEMPLRTKRDAGEDRHAGVSFFLAVFFFEFYFVVHDLFIMGSLQNSMAQWSI